MTSTKKCIATYLSRCIRELLDSLVRLSLVDTQIRLENWQWGFGLVQSVIYKPI